LDSFGKNLLLFTFALDLFGPVGVLIVMKRWRGQWQPAVRWCVLSFTFIAFLLTGMAEVALRFIELRQPHWSDTSDQALLHFYFLVGGSIGVWFAICGTGVGLALLAIWRVLYPSTFRSLMRYPNEPSVPF
jgi:hypothetical protein